MEGVMLKAMRGCVVVIGFAVIVFFVHQSVCFGLVFAPVNDQGKNSNQEAIPRVFQAVPESRVSSSNAFPSSGSSGVGAQQDSPAFPATITFSKAFHLSETAGAAATFTPATIIPRGFLDPHINSEVKANSLRGLPVEDSAPIIYGMASKDLTQAVATVKIMNPGDAARIIGYIHNNLENPKGMPLAVQILANPDMGFPAANAIFNHFDDIKTAQEIYDKINGYYPGFFVEHGEAIFCYRPHAEAIIEGGIVSAIIKKSGVQGIASLNNDNHKIETNAVALEKIEKQTPTSTEPLAQDSIGTDKKTSLAYTTFYKNVPGMFVLGDYNPETSLIELRDGGKNVKYGKGDWRFQMPDSLELPELEKFLGKEVFSSLTVVVKFKEKPVTGQVLTEADIAEVVLFDDKHNDVVTFTYGDNTYSPDGPIRRCSVSVKASVDENGFVTVGNQVYQLINSAGMTYRPYTDNYRGKNVPAGKVITMNFEEVITTVYPKGDPTTEITFILSSINDTQIAGITDRRETKLISTGVPVSSEQSTSEGSGGVQNIRELTNKIVNKYK
jgi:hypothetical protein